MNPGAAPALRLLGDALEHGIWRVPEVGSWIEAGAERAATPGGAPGSADDEAARHQHLFGFCVPPLAGVFVDPEGRAGGVAADRILTAAAGAGLNPSFLGDSAEHVSSVARLVAGLLEVERKAASTAAFDALAWVPSLAMAVRQEGGADYAELLDVLAEVLVSVAVPGSAVLDDLPPPTGRSDAGVSDLADWVTTHLGTGLYCGRGMLQRWGRAAGVPRGFGRRGLMAANLFRSAAHLEAMPELTKAIMTDANVWAAYWDARAKREDSAGVWARIWRDRIARFQGTIEEIAVRIGSYSSSSDPGV